MNVSSAPAGRNQLTVRILEVVALVWASLVAVTAAFYVQLIAVAVVLVALVAFLTLWRPRLGFYLALFLAVGLEPQKGDPIMFFGWVIQSDVSSWTPLRFVNFSILELLFLVVAVGALAHAAIRRHGIAALHLRWPLLLFSVLLALSVAWGRATGGDLKIALWETRSLFLAGLVALLLPSLAPRREHVVRMFSIVTLAVVLLSIELIWRRYVLLGGVRTLDLDFAHETPVFLNVTVMLLLARLLWPASGWQRLPTLLIPLILFAEMVTERRAGWIGLDLGLMLIALFVFRLRRRLFFWTVLPLAIFYAGYLVAFWNSGSGSLLVQPARAVRSIVAPDARDAASNQYRVVETADIRLNIHAQPVMGLGFGRPFVFYYPLPDLSGGWPLWRYTPHNALLWVWMRMGAVGFVAFLALFGAGIVRGVQLLKCEMAGPSGPVLVASVCALSMILVYSYVDLGLTSSRLTVLLGLVIGVLGAWSGSVVPSTGGSQ